MYLCQKTTVFKGKTVVFLCKKLGVSNTMLTLGAHLAHKGYFFCFFGAQESLHCSIFLCGPEHDICKAFAGLFVCFHDDMGVNVCGGTYLCMAQAFRDGDNILSAVNQDRGHCVPLRYNYDKPGKP